MLGSKGKLSFLCCLGLVFCKALSRVRNPPVLMVVGPLSRQEYYLATPSELPSLMLMYPISHWASVSSPIAK